MAAKTKKTEVVLEPISEGIQNVEAISEIKVEEGKLYKFKPNDKCTFLKKEVEYMLTAELYELFVKKGYGK